MASQSRHARPEMSRKGLESPAGPLKLRTWTQCLTNALADLAVVPRASTGSAGGVGVAGALLLADAVGVAKGVGLGGSPEHPDAPTPSASASAASERTVRLCDTTATPKNLDPSAAGHTGHGSGNLPTPSRTTEGVTDDLWTDRG
jgi:hypothetical protein